MATTTPPVTVVVANNRVSFKLEAADAQVGYQDAARAIVDFLIAIQRNTLKCASEQDMLTLVKETGPKYLWWDSKNALGRTATQVDRDRLMYLRMFVVKYHGLTTKLTHPVHCVAALECVCAVFQKWRVEANVLPNPISTLIPKSLEELFKTLTTTVESAFNSVNQISVTAHRVPLENTLFAYFTMVTVFRFCSARHLSRVPLRAYLISKIKSTNTAEATNALVIQALLSNPINNSNIESILPFNQTAVLTTTTETVEEDEPEQPQETVPPSEEEEEVVEPMEQDADAGTGGGGDGDREMDEAVPDAEVPQEEAQDETQRPEEEHPAIYRGVSQGKMIDGNTIQPVDDLSFSARYKALWDTVGVLAVSDLQFHDLYTSLKTMPVRNWFNDEYIVRGDSQDARQHQLIEAAAGRRNKQHTMTMYTLEQCESARSGAALTIPDDMPKTAIDLSQPSQKIVDMRLEDAHAHLRISGKYVSLVHETYANILTRDAFDTMLHGATYGGIHQMHTKHAGEISRMLQLLKDVFLANVPFLDKKSAWEEAVYRHFPPNAGGLIGEGDSAIYKAADVVHKYMVELGFVHETVKQTFSGAVADDMSSTDTNEQLRTQHDRFYLAYELCGSALSTAARAARSLRVLIKLIGNKYKSKAFLPDPAVEPLNAAPFIWTTDAFPMLWLVRSADFADCGAASKFLTSCFLSSLVRGIGALCSVFRAIARASYACIKAAEVQIAFKEAVRVTIIEYLTAKSNELRKLRARNAAADQSAGVVYDANVKPEDVKAFEDLIDKVSKDEGTLTRDDILTPLQTLLAHLGEESAEEGGRDKENYDTWYTETIGKKVDMKWVDSKYKQPPVRASFEHPHCGNDNYDCAFDDPQRAFPMKNAYEHHTYDTEHAVGVREAADAPAPPWEHAVWVRLHNALILHLANIDNRIAQIDALIAECATHPDTITPEVLKKHGVNMPHFDKDKIVQYLDAAVHLNTNTRMQLIKQLASCNLAIPRRMRKLGVDWQLCLILTTLGPDDSVIADETEQRLVQMLLKTNNDPLLHNRYLREWHRHYKEKMAVIQAEAAKQRQGEEGKTSTPSPNSTPMDDNVEVEAWPTNSAFVFGDPLEPTFTIDSRNESFHISGCTNNKESLLIELLYESVRRLAYSSPDKSNYARAFRFLNIIGAKHAAVKVINIVKDRLYREQQLRIAYKDDIDNYRCYSMEDWKRMQDVVLVLDDNRDFLKKVYQIDRITELLYDVPQPMLKDIVNVHDAHLHEFIDYVEGIGILDDNTNPELANGSPTGADGDGNNKTVADAIRALVLPADAVTNKAKRVEEIENRRKKIFQGKLVFGADLITRFDTHFRLSDVPQEAYDTGRGVDIKRWCVSISNYVTATENGQCRSKLVWALHCQAFQTDTHRLLGGVLLGEYGYDVTSTEVEIGYAMLVPHLEHVVIASRYRIPRQTTYLDAEFLCYPRKAVFSSPVQFAKTVFVYRIPSYQFRVMAFSVECSSRIYEVVYSKRARLSMGLYPRHVQFSAILPILTYAHMLTAYLTNGFNGANAVLSAAKAALSYARIQLAAVKMRGAKAFYTGAVMDGVSSRCVSANANKRARDHGCILARLTGAHLPPPGAVGTTMMSTPCNNNCYLQSYHDPIDFSQWEDPLVEDTLPPTKDDLSTVPPGIANIQHLSESYDDRLKELAEVVKTFENAARPTAGGDLPVEDVHLKLLKFAILVRRCAFLEMLAELRTTLVKFWSRKLRLIHSLKAHKPQYNLRYYAQVLGGAGDITLDAHVADYKRMYAVYRVLFGDDKRTDTITKLLSNVSGTGKVSHNAAQVFENGRLYAQYIVHNDADPGKVPDFNVASVDSAWVLVLYNVISWMSVYNRDLQVHANRLMNAWYTIHPPPKEQHRHRQLYGLVFKRIGQVGRARRLYADEQYIDAITCTHVVDYAVGRSPTATTIEARPLDTTAAAAAAAAVPISNKALTHASPISKIGSLIDSRKRAIKHMIDDGHKFDPSCDFSHMGMTIAKNPNGNGTLSVFTQDEVEALTAQNRKLVSCKEAMDDPYAIRNAMRERQQDGAVEDAAEDELMDDVDTPQHGFKYIDACGTERFMGAITLSGAGDIHRHSLMREYRRGGTAGGGGSEYIQSGYRNVTMGGGDPLCNISFSLGGQHQQHQQQHQQQHKSVHSISPLFLPGSPFVMRTYPSAEHRRLFRRTPHDEIGALVARAYGHLLIPKRHHMDDNVEADAVRLFYEEISKMSWTIIGVVLTTTAHTLMTDLLKYGENINTSLAKLMGDTIYKALNVDRTVYGYQRMRTYSRTGNIVNDIRFSLYDRFWLTGGTNTVYMHGNENWADPIRLLKSPASAYPSTVGDAGTIKTHLTLNDEVDLREVESIRKDFPHVKFSARVRRQEERQQQQQPYSKRLRVDRVGGGNEGVPRMDTSAYV